MTSTINDTDSILLTVKDLLGISEEDTAFDTEILTHINSVFLDLQQIGVGPENGFSITSSKETWLDFIDNKLLLGTVRSYVYIKVKLIFDPPSSSTVQKSFESMADRYEWRMNVLCDSKNQNE